MKKPHKTLHIKSHRLPLPEPTALNILLCELPLVLIWAVAFLISFLTDYRIDPIGAGYRYTALSEYITVPLIICIATALVSDLIERERKARENR